MDESMLALECTSKAAEACRDMVLGEEALRLLENGFTVRQYLHRLIAAGLWFDALALVAQGLPKGGAVEWACRCIRADGLGDPDEEGLLAAEGWLADPSEENRRAASKAAFEAGYATPAAWAAAAAGWAGGSMAEEGEPTVSPPSDLTARAVSAAVVLVAVRRPAKMGQLQRACLQRGLDLVDERSVENLVEVDGNGG